MILKICPYAEVDTVVMKIPMPGHFVVKEQENSIFEDLM